eukprot:2797524-Rhodomonas_salina.1
MSCPDKSQGSLPEDIYLGTRGPLKSQMDTNQCVSPEKICKFRLEEPPSQFNFEGNSLNADSAVFADTLHLFSHVAVPDDLTNQQVKIPLNPPPSDPRHAHRMQAAAGALASSTAGVRNKVIAKSVAMRQRVVVKPVDDGESFSYQMGKISSCDSCTM